MKKSPPDAKVGNTVLLFTYPTKVKIRINRILNNEFIEGTCVEEDEHKFYSPGQAVTGYLINVLEICYLKK